MVIGIDNGDNDEAFKLEMNEGNIVIPSSKHLKDSSGHTWVMGLFRNSG